MKIAVTSDLHGYLPDIEPCEVLFICGDISPLDIQSNIPKMQVWLRNKFASWINNLPCNQVLMVAGNHDFIFQWLTEHPEEMDFYIGKPTIQEITRQAQNMIDRVADFYEDYKELGKKLKAVGAAYNSGVNKLKSGGHSITTSARQVMTIGTRLSKGRELIEPEELPENVNIED